MRTNTVTGKDHPDFVMGQVYEGEQAYMIDGLPELTDDDSDPRKCALCPLLWIAAGSFFGAALFFLGRWSA